MKFETAYNKRASFFKEKKARLTIDISNYNNQIIPKDSIVEIINKSKGLKIFFDIECKGVYINNVSYEYLEILK